MASEYDVAAAWLKIIRGDTGTGSLVDLSGKANPAALWSDPEAADLPVVVLPDFPPSGVHGGAPYRRIQTWRPEARTARGGHKLAVQMLDRLETITTHSAFAAESLDIQVTPVGRSRGEPGDAGGYRLIASYRLTVTV